MRRATSATLLLLAMLLGALVAPARAADTPRRFVGYELAQARRAAFVAAARAPDAARAQVAAAAAPAAVQTAPSQVLSVQQISRQNVPPSRAPSPTPRPSPTSPLTPTTPT